MIELVRPRSFIPLHGTRHHLVRHAELATSLGVGDAMVIENGEVALLAGLAGEGEPLRREGRWPSGRVHLGFGRQVQGETLKERTTLAAEGIVFAAVPANGGRLSGSIQLASRGVLQDPQLTEVLVRAALEAERVAMAAGRLSEAELKDAVRLTVRRALHAVVGYKVQVVVTLVPVTSEALAR